MNKSNFIAFSSTSFGRAKTKQQAIINLLTELEFRNIKAKMIGIVKTSDLGGFTFGAKESFKTYKGSSPLIILDIEANKFIEPYKLIVL